MEQIIEIYGKFLLGLAVLFLFLVLLFTGIRDENGNVGVWHMMGAFLTEEQPEKGSEFAVYVEEGARKGPEIFCRKKEPLLVGSYPASELFGASDCENTELDPVIEGVYDRQGVVEYDIYDAQTGQISFDRPGIYLVQLCATDRWNHTKRCRILLPVNGGVA